MAHSSPTYTSFKGGCLLCLLIKKYTKNDWLYETGRDEPEILGSGSTYYNIFRTRDEKLALEKAFDGYRNYLIRSRKENGKEIRQWYDGPTRKWIND